MRRQISFRNICNKPKYMCILAVTHYNFGIGHIVRTVSICNVLKNAIPDCNVVLLNGGEPIGKIKTGSVLIQHLPPLRKEYLLSKDQVSNEGKVERIKIERSIAIGSLIQKYQPTHLISEFYPFSPERMHHMFEKNFDLLEKYKTKLICSIRDIPLSDCYKSLKKQSDTVKFLLNKYDLILHHTDPNICDVKETRYLSEILNGKNVIQTGYVVREGFIGKAKRVQNKNRLLVTVGGGRDGIFILKLIMPYLNLYALEQFEGVDIACGPMMSNEDYEMLKSGIKMSSIIIHRGFVYSEKLISKASCAITMAGYNSLAELASSGVKCIMIPRPNSFEQGRRAELFSKAGLGVIIDYPFSSKTIFKQIDSLLRDRREISFQNNGAEISAKAILDL